MTNVWCVRANGGVYAPHFVAGSYFGIGWSRIGSELGDATSKEELYPIVKAAYADVKSPIVIGNNVGQIARFLFDIRPGDWVITPAADTEWLQYGQVPADSPYYHADGGDGCPYRHRRRIDWSGKRLERRALSVPFQNSIRSMLTVFSVAQGSEFLAEIGKGGTLVPEPGAYDPYRVVLEQILELDASEFEILVGHLLTALGFEGSEVVGKSGDGGVDATGELRIRDAERILAAAPV